MQKKLLFVFILFYTSIFCYAEKFDTLCGFTLGTSLADFKNNEIFQFTTPVRNNSLSKNNCICYFFEPYILQADIKGNEKGYEEFNNKKQEYAKNNSLSYGGGKIYAVFFVFYDDILISIELDFFGRKSTARKGKIVSSNEDTYFSSDKWLVIQNAVAEKYQLQEKQSKSSSIPIYYDRNVPKISDYDRNSFLNYNVDNVLDRIGTIRAAVQILNQLNGKTSHYNGAEELIMHLGTYADTTRQVDFTSWSYKDVLHQPKIILYDIEAFTRMEKINGRNNIDAVKDQI